MSIEIKEVRYDAWGNCLRLSNGFIEAIVTIDYGPRVVSFRLTDRENVFFEDSADRFTVSGPEMDSHYGTGAVFHRRGGHLGSIAPIRVPESFFPDNSSVLYTIRPDGVSLISPREKSDGIKYSTEILMGDGASDIMIVHGIKNTSHERKKLSVWSSTALRAGGLEVIPQSFGDTQPMQPNRILALWPGTTLTDPRLFAGERYLTIRQDPEMEKEFILGVNNITGWAAYVLPDTTLIKRYVHDETSCYPNHDCSYRTRVSGCFAELDSFSPIYLVEPGEGIRHVDNLSLFATRNGVNPVDETSIENFIHNLC